MVSVTTSIEASRDIAGVDDVSVGEDWSIQFLGTD